MNWQNIKAIFKKELQSYLNSPSAYVVLIVFLVLWQFLFFKDAFLVAEASLQGLYSWFPWLVLMFVPAITMGAITKERDEGTLELVLTQPIRESEFVVGKFFGAFAFACCALLSTIPIAISFNIYGNIDWGVYISQVFGSMLYVAAYTALGIFISGFFGAQIASLLVTIVAGLILLIAGTEFFTMNLPLSLGPVLERLSLLSHFSAISRGAIGFSDLWYFASFTLTFIALTYYQLQKRKLGTNKTRYSKDMLMLPALVGLVIITNILGNQITARLDLTRNKIYTLSNSTKTILKELPEDVTITLYASDNLPSQYLPTLRETKTLLSDYRTYAKNSTLQIVDPSTSTEIENEAKNKGVVPIQFNVVGKEEFQVKTGYLDINIQYRETNEVIPYVQSLNGLEYELTSAIKKLTATEKKNVAFLSGHQEQNMYASYGTLNAELNKLYTTTMITLDETVKEIPTNVDVLIVAGAKTDFSESTKNEITKFMQLGKPILFLVDTYEVDTQSGLASSVNPNVLQIIAELGITVNKDLVYDLRSNSTIRYGNGVLNYLIPYPLWVKSLVSETSPLKDLQNSFVQMPWASSINIDSAKAAEKGYQITTLLKTSPYAGTKTGTISIEPNQEFSQQNLSERILGVALEGGGQSGITTHRIVIIGDSDFLSSEYTQDGTSNAGAGLTLISWLSNDTSLSEISTKTRAPAQLLFDSSYQPTLIKWANITLVAILPGIYGVIRLWRRKKLATPTYNPKR